MLHDWTNQAEAENNGEKKKVWEKRSALLRRYRSRFRLLGGPPPYVEGIAASDVTGRAQVVSATVPYSRVISCGS
jgi:hypothetical protein